MALTATVSHASGALPRRRHYRRRAPASSTHLITPSPSLPSASSPATATTLDRVLADLESNPRLLTPALLTPLLAALPLHDSPRRRLAFLRGLLPVSLLRRHPELALRLLHLHASLGLLAYAHHIFDHLLPAATRRDQAFPWNCLLAGYAHLDRHGDALAVYLQMDEEGVPRDRFSFLCALRACAGAGAGAAAEIGRAVHRDAVRAGLAGEVSVCDALVEMYAECGDLEMARKVFDAMQERDGVSWNVLLAGCLRHGTSPMATEVHASLSTREGHRPESAALSTMLSLSSVQSGNCGKQGPEVHAWVIRHGLATELSVANALVEMYSRNNELAHAMSVFESMAARDLISWNAIISAHRRDFGVLMVFRRMVDFGTQPDETTFAAVLSACEDLGLVEGGTRLFSEMENENRIQPTLEHCTCVVNMLGKAGLVSEAYEFISKRRPLGHEPTILKALLNVSSVHGNIRIGEIATKMLSDLEADNVHNFVTNGNL